MAQTSIMLIGGAIMYVPGILIFQLKGFTQKLYILREELAQRLVEGDGEDKDKDFNSDNDPTYFASDTSSPPHLPTVAASLCHLATYLNKHQQSTKNTSTSKFKGQTLLVDEPGSPAPSDITPALSRAGASWNHSTGPS